MYKNKPLAHNVLLINEFIKVFVYLIGLVLSLKLPQFVNLLNNPTTTIFNSLIKI